MPPVLLMPLLIMFMTGSSEQRKDDWTSMSIPSDGSYGIPEGVIYSHPVICRGWCPTKYVQGLEISEFSKEKMHTTYEELVEETRIR